MTELLLLGPVDLRVEGDSRAVGPPRQRALLGVLALASGRVVGTAQAIEAMWGEDAPATAVNAIQVYVNGLRKVLHAAGMPSALVTQSPGYRLLLPPLTTDLERFDRDVEAAAEAPGATRRTEVLRHALALWRGPLLADIDAPYVEAARTHWTERYAAARLEWQRSELALGHHDDLVAVLESDARADPYREPIWCLLALALYRSGRQGDALAALRRLRRLLVNDLGVDPSAEVEDLERRILAQAAEIAAPAGRPGGELHLGSLQTHVVSSTDAAPSGASLVLPDGERVDLSSASAILGRHAECDVVLASQSVSRQHARLTRTASGHEVVDLGSTNGTTVNGVTVGEDGATVADGDRIGLGRVSVTFRTGRP